jgi:DNA-binding transcriptional LysR family regulator
MDNLNQLRTFMAVYRTGSVSRAAELVNLTQPAVSKQLQQLEQRLSHTLFTRVARGVLPSPVAHEFARRVAPHLDALEALSDSLKIGNQALAGTVFLGGPTEFISAKILPALVGLPEQQIQVRVQFGTPEVLSAELEAGALDLVVQTVRRSSPKLHIQPLYNEELVLVGNADWRTRLPPVLEPKHLQDLPFLAYSEDLPLLRRYWRSVFGQLPKFTAALVMPDLRALAFAAARGYGITVLPRYLLEGFFAKGELFVLHAPPTPPTNQLYLASRLGVQPRVEFVQKLLERAALGW